MVVIYFCDTESPNKNYATEQQTARPKPFIYKITVLATKATTTNDVVRSARHQTDHVCNDVALPAVTQHFDISANGVWKCVRTLYMHAKHLYNTVLVTSHTLSINVPIIK